MVLRVSSSGIVGGIVLVAVKGADDEVFERVCTGVPVDGGICVGLCLALSDRTGRGFSNVRKGDLGAKF